jgi:hypothetical protein
LLAAAARRACEISVRVTLLRSARAFVEIDATMIGGIFSAVVIPFVLFLYKRRHPR